MSVGEVSGGKGKINGADQWMVEAGVPRGSRRRAAGWEGASQSHNKQTEAGRANGALSHALPAHLRGAYVMAMLPCAVATARKVLLRARATTFTLSGRRSRRARVFRRVYKAKLGHRNGWLRAASGPLGGLHLRYGTDALCH
jgi:hypothetical protein